MSKIVSKVVFTNTTPRYIASRGQSSVVCIDFAVSFASVPGLTVFGSFWGTPKDPDDKASKLRFKPSLKGTAKGMRQSIELSQELSSEIIASVESAARDWPMVRDAMLSATRVYRLGPPSKVKNDGISLDEVTGNELETGEEQTEDGLSLETATEQA